MVKIVSGIVFIVLFHLTIFILYPDTGRYGDYYLYGLIGGWGFLYLYLITSRFYRLLTLGIFSRIVFFITMMIISLLVIPQQDKKTILSKILTLKLPDRHQIERGKIKYLNNLLNLNLNRIINPILNELNNKTKRFLNQLTKE